MMKYALSCRLIRILAVSLALAPAAAAGEKAAPAPAPAAAAVPVPVPLPVPEYALVREKSTLKFIATQNGAPLEGRFTAFDAAIAFDPERPGESHLRVVVDLNSLALADSQTRDTLLSADWLRAAVNPEAVFTAPSLEHVPGTRDYYARGELRLRGVTAPVTLNFILAYTDDAMVVASGYATLQRQNFGIGQGEWAKDDVVKQAVRVEFRVTARKVAP